METIMKFFPTGASLPKDEQMLKDIDAAATRLYAKLVDLNVNLLEISDYNKRYFGEYTIKCLRSALQKYSYLLAWSVAFSRVKLDRLVFIDYGGGPGTLSLLAKEFGIGRVIYNDIYGVSCRDARVIGQKVKSEANDYILGDIDNLIDFLKRSGISCNAIVSSDVIEHIYDIESYLRKLSALSEISLSIVMATTANSLNPLIKRQRMRMHFDVEYKDREETWGFKKRDSLRSYLNIRRECVSQYAPSLSDEEVDSLAMATRGLVISDIEKCVEEYLRTGRISRKPNHPTNTCDPFTGNWAEHLMDVNHLKRVLCDEGFKVSVLSGYYGTPNSAVKRIIGRCLNPLISVFREKGLVLAPFYALYASRC
jgi:hypothetical protein